MKAKGFSLIEVMIVVAIIAILSAIAYPSYINYKIRVHRGEVKAELLNLSARLQTYKTVNHNYDGAKSAIITSSVSKFPNTGTALYNIDLTVDSDKKGYTLKATPIAGTIQKDNGQVCLNDQGFKFWKKSQATCGTLSATTSWDDE